MVSNQLFSQRTGRKTKHSRGYPHQQQKSQAGTLTEDAVMAHTMDTMTLKDTTTCVRGGGIVLDLRTRLDKFLT